MKQLLKKKLTLLCMLCLAMCFTLTGCMLDFDASGYIKAGLDASTKGEFEAYAEITGSTVEEVEAIYNQTIDTELSYIDAYNVTEEQKANFRALFVDMYKNFKYEVGEATKNDDGSYSVPVTTYKLTIFEGILEEGEEYLINFAQAEVDAGRTPTQEQMEAEAINYMYDAMKTNLAELQYAEAETTNITVSPSKNGSQTVYSASESDLQALVQKMVDVENAQ